MIVALGLWISPDSGPPAETGFARDGARMTYQSVEALAAQCGPTYSYSDGLTGPLGQMTSADPALARYQFGPRTMVPMVGLMSPDGPDLSDRFLSPADTQPTRQQVLRGMWDGLMVAYYTPDVDNADLVTLEAMSRRPDLNLLVLPWTQGTLPQGRSWAFATWGASQSCHDFGTFVVEQFRDKHPNEPRPTPSSLDSQPEVIEQIRTQCSPAAPCRVPVSP